MALNCMGVRVIDSMAFIPQALASLPKVFGIPDLVKGYFPYLFLNDQNEFYNGPFPEADLYCPAQMKSDSRDRFYKWYNENKHQRFDMQEVGSSFKKILYANLQIFRH